MSVLYKASSDGSYRVARDAFDSVTSRQNINKFSLIGSPPSGGCGQPTYYRKNIIFSDYGINPAADILIAVRMRPAYAGVQFSFDPKGFTLPAQGSHIESSGSTQAGVTRKVVVDKSFASASILFDAAVYSQNLFSH